ncbi:MAG TPA: DUF2867 domain-containing protein [Methylocella sp.]
MRVQQVPTESKLTALLSGVAFSEAYRLLVDEPDIDAITAARRVMEHPPIWIRGLMSLRNGIASLLSLKPAQLALHEKQDESSLAGAFPVISRAPERVVLGFDDKHLDFRIVVESVGVDTQRSQIAVTTLVRPHNLLGRTYLAGVLPFHRIIVPAMLVQAAQA